MIAFLGFSVLCHRCTNSENHQTNVNNLPNSKIHTFTSFFLPNTDDNRHNTSQIPVAVRSLNSNPKQRQISQTINEVNAQLIARSATMSNAIPKIFFHIFLTSLPSDFLLELLPPRQLTLVTRAAVLSHRAIQLALNIALADKTLFGILANLLYVHTCTSLLISIFARL